MFWITKNVFHICTVGEVMKVKVLEIQIVRITVRPSTIL